MELVNAKLGLSKEANETSVIKAIDDINAKHELSQKELMKAKGTITEQEGTIKNQEIDIKKLETKIEEFEAKEVIQSELNAKKAVAEAIKAGKFDASKKEALEKIAIANIDAFNIMTESVTGVVQGADVAALLIGSNEGLGKFAAKYGVKEEEFTYEHLFKNNPKVLTKLRAENPKVYTALEKTFIESEEQDED